MPNTMVLGVIWADAALMPKAKTARVRVVAERKEVRRMVSLFKIRDN